MANLEITNIDNGSVILANPVTVPELLTLAGADEIAEGTILARDSVTLKYVLFVKGGTTQANGSPKAVLPYAVSSTGAGDVPVDLLVNGHVIKERLVIDADGDDSNVDGIVRDQLRNYGILALSVQELGNQDNQ